MHTTTIIKGELLESGQILVGEAGGLSEIFEVNESSSSPGLLAVETEHGVLYLDPENEYIIQAG